MTEKTNTRVWVGGRMAALAAVIASFLAVALCLTLVGCAGDNEKGVAARYGDGKTVTEQEVNDYTAQFRREHTYDDDMTWATYLYEQGLTASTWRNRAIGSIVEARLIEQRAQELGISVDESMVADQMAADKEAVGIAADDAEAWKSYLEARGLTEDSYLENLRQSILQYQVLSQEVALDPVSDVQVIDDYIGSNLISRVVRCYSVLVFDSEKDAEAALDSLKGLSGDALSQEFAALLEKDDSTETTAENGGNAGWDIANSWGQMQQDLNEEMLKEGELSSGVHELDGKYYVVLCTLRFAFEKGTSYDDIADDKLKAIVYDAATYDAWGKLTSEYIAKLRDDAHVMVHEVSEPLPYDVDYLIKEAPADETSESSAGSTGSSAGAAGSDSSASSTSSANAAAAVG